MLLTTWIVNFIDLIWIPVALVVVAPRQRVWAVLFVLLCALSMRLQIELMVDAGYGKGFTLLLDSDVKTRATLIYGIFTALYLALVYFSPRTPWAVLLSASIVIYITAFTVSMCMMAI